MNFTATLSRLKMSLIRLILSFPAEPHRPLEGRWAKSRNLLLSSCRLDRNLLKANRRSLVFSATAIAISIALSLSSAEAKKEKSKPNKNDDEIYAELTKAPSKARDRQNPLQRDPEAVAAGAKLFGQKCAECHGEMAEGTRKAPSLLADKVQQATPGTIFWILTNGVVRRGMPVWSKLPEAQRWQLVTYIKSLSPSAAKSEAALDKTKTTR